MLITYDYSFVSSKEKQLIERGYGEMSVHSLSFQRHYTDEQKQKNAKLHSTMSNEQWNAHCDKVSRSFGKPLTEIANVLASKYDIHQVSEETSTLAHYSSDWDLYFWSNKGWNNKDHMDCFTLTFNRDRSAKANMELLEDILPLLDSLDHKNISCRVQYNAIMDQEKVNEEVLKICEKLTGKFINYSGMVGKVKIVSEKDGTKRYGFFKKNARNKYYTISGVELLTAQLQGGR